MTVWSEYSGAKFDIWQERRAAMSLGCGAIARVGAPTGEEHCAVTLPESGMECMRLKLRPCEQPNSDSQPPGVVSSRSTKAVAASSAKMPRNAPTVAYASESSPYRSRGHAVAVPPHSPHASTATSASAQSHAETGSRAPSTPLQTPHASYSSSSKCETKWPCCRRLHSGGGGCGGLGGGGGGGCGDGGAGGGMGGKGSSRGGGSGGSGGSGECAPARGMLPTAQTGHSASGYCEHSSLPSASAGKKGSIASHAFLVATHSEAHGVRTGAP
eukprot:scaffold49326_cov29-Tisochrysis_lutea.AAC.1